MIRKTLSYKNSFVLTIDFFRKVEKIFTDKLGASGYKVCYNCISQNGIFECDSYYDLVDCDNSLDRSIKTVKMHIEALGDITLTADIRLGKHEDELVALLDKHTIEGYVEGCGEHVDIAYDEIDYQIRKILKSRKYTIISKAGFIFTLFSTFVFTGIYICLFGFPERFSIPLFAINMPYDDLPGWFIIFQIFTALFIGFSVALFLRDPVKKIFPRIVFLFGDGEDTILKKEKLKVEIFWNVIVVLIVGIAGIVINEFIQNLLLRIL